MTPREITSLMEEKYISETGLGRLDLQDTQILENGRRTVKNENGILYLAFMLIQRFRAVKDKYLPSFQYCVIKSLQRLPGLYNRQPFLKQVTRSDSHDNAIGVCAIAALNNWTDIPNEMISHWWHNWFCFDNVNPGKFSFKQFRQPGEVAIYYITAGRRAPFLFFLWFFVGVFINAHRKEKDEAQARLVWLRLWICDTKGVKGFVQKRLYKYLKTYWTSRMIEKYEKEANILNFGENHPITLFQQVIDAKV